MATYTNSLPARYTTAKGALSRAATKLLSRTRPVGAASNNLKREYGADNPDFGGSLKTTFNTSTGALTKGYLHPAVGGKSRTR